MATDANPTIMNLTLEIRFIACVKKEFVHKLLDAKYPNRVFGIPSPSEPHFEPLITLLSRQIQSATGQRCQTIVEYLRRRNPGVRGWTIFASDGLGKNDESTFTNEEYVGLVQDLCGGSITKAGIDQTLMPSAYRAELKKYVANNKSHYSAKILLLSPGIEIKSLDDSSWHAPLMAIFKSVLNPAEKESIPFNFSKSTTLVYTLDPPKPVSLDSIKCFMGASQYMEEPLRNLQVSGYVERPSQTDISDSTDKKHDNIPIGLRDVPDLRSEATLWKQIKQCDNLDALKVNFCHTGSISNDLSPGTGTYDLSWMTSFREANVGQVEKCIGAIRIGFAMHLCGLDVITEQWKRNVRVGNIFNAIHFNLHLFATASQLNHAKGLENWLDKFTSRMWDSKLRILLYVATFISPPETLVNKIKLPWARMAVEFLIRLGLQRTVTPNLYQKNINHGPGEAEDITPENEDSDKTDETLIVHAAPNAAMMNQITTASDEINAPVLRKLGLETPEFNPTSTFQNLKKETSDPTLKQMNSQIMMWLEAIDETVKPSTDIQQLKEKPKYKNMDQRRSVSTANDTMIANNLEYNNKQGDNEIGSKLIKAPGVLLQHNNSGPRPQLSTPNQNKPTQLLLQCETVNLESKPLEQKKEVSSLNSPARVESSNNDEKVSCTAEEEYSAQNNHHSSIGNSKSQDLVLPIAQQSSGNLSTGIVARPGDDQEQQNDNSSIIATETPVDGDNVSTCTIMAQTAEDLFENESGQPLAAIDTLGLFQPIRQELWKATRTEARLRMNVLKVKCLANSINGKSNHSIAQAELGDLMEWRCKVFNPDSETINQNELCRLKEQMQHLHEAYGRAQGVVAHLIQQLDHLKELSTAVPQACDEFSQRRADNSPTHYMHQTLSASQKKQ